MVAPLVGRALMGMGADIAGSSAARSAAGSVLKTGKGSGIKDYAKLKETADNTKSMLKTLNKMNDVLSKASPMLSQQLTIINKSISLFLRPIGDIMAKFLRPMAIWLIKVAIKWNKLFGSGEGDNQSTSAKKDALEQLEKEKTSAVMRGEDTTTIDKKIEEKKADISNDKLFNSDGLLEFQKWFQDLPDKLADSFKSLSEWSQKVWDTYIVPGFEGIANWTQDIWDTYIVPGFEGIANWTQDIWDTYIVPSFEGMFEWNKNLWEQYIVPAFSGILNWTNDIWDNYIVPGFSSITEWSKNIWDTYIMTGFADAINWAANIYKFFETGFADVVNWGTRIWDIIKSSIKSMSPFGEEDKAVGGQIQTTGSYNLHAGERVITAGENSKNNNKNSSMVVNNYITLNAQVSSEIDIRSLAKKLAELSETEIRRRVSYT